MMSTPLNFDPEPGVAYGVCVDCPMTLPDKTSADAHLRATLHDARSPRIACAPHTIHVDNPTREERIQRKIGLIVSDVVEEVVNHLGRLVASGAASADEVRAALAGYDEFADAWDEYLHDGEDPVN